MKTKKENKPSKAFSLSSGLVIICCFIAAYLIFTLVFGNPDNFMNGDPKNHPLPGNLLGTIYKGGIIIPVIQETFLFFFRESYNRRRLQSNSFLSHIILQNVIRSIFI